MSSPPDVAAEFDALLLPEARSSIEQGAATLTFALLGGLGALALLGTIAAPLAARRRDQRKGAA